MSWRAYRAVTIGSLAEGPTEQAVLHCLAEHAHGDDGSGAFPSNGTICEETKFKERAVRNAIGRLRTRRAIDMTGELPNGTPIYRVYWRDVDQDVADWIATHAQEIAGRFQGDQEAIIAEALQLSPRAVRGARRRLARGEDNPTAGGCRCVVRPPAPDAGGDNASTGTTCRHPRHDVPLYPAGDAAEPLGNGNGSSSGDARTREADHLVKRIYSAALNSGYDDLLEDDELASIQIALDDVATGTGGTHEQAVSEVERFLADHPPSDLAPAIRIDVLLRESLKRHALEASGQPRLGA